MSTVVSRETLIHINGDDGDHVVDIRLRTDAVITIRLSFRKTVCDKDGMEGTLTFDLPHSNGLSALHNLHQLIGEALQYAEQEVPSLRPERDGPAK